MKTLFTSTFLSLAVLGAVVMPNIAEAINLPYHTKANKKILCYLTTGGQQKGWIDPGDDVIVNRISGKWAYVNYPVPGGRANRWIVLSDIYIGPRPVPVPSSNFPTQTSVKITYNGQVVDTFNGVSAIYPVAGVADGNTTYNCAAYVKKYYQKHFGFAPYNLLPGKTPIGTNGRYFAKVYDPRPGDIIGMATSSNGMNGHWGICKGVEGTNIVLIEQNKRSKSTYSPSVPVNRRISKYDVNIYRW